MPLESNNNTVLIIDDETTNIQVLSDFLEAQAIEIMVAKNGTDGISRAKKGQPDLILLDIRMSGMDCGFNRSTQHMH